MSSSIRVGEIGVLHNSLPVVDRFPLGYWHHARLEEYARVMNHRKCVFLAFLLYQHVFG